MKLVAVSVVMPVLNAMPYLDDAIASILAQTYSDFELIIGDDNSTDGSREHIREWARRDPRIRVLESDRSQGPAGSSNWVAQAATGALVARMDADDIAHPDRLRRLVEVLASNLDAVLVGSLFESIDQHGRTTRGRDRAALLRTGGLPGIAHSSIVYRAAAFRNAGGYSLDHDFYEDLEFYVRMAQQGAILVLPEAYVRYRYSASSSRQTADRGRVHQALEGFLQWHALQFGCGGHRVRSRKVSPGVLMVIGSHRLWAGNRPGILGQIWRDAALGWNRQSAVLVGWGLWGTLSPSSLRAVLRLRLRLRDWAAGRIIKDGQVYRWQSPARADAVTEVPKT